eukprot:5364837-Alexandrium_andersonii.AAC.2
MDSNKSAARAQNNGRGMRSQLRATKAYSNVNCYTKHRRLKVRVRRRCYFVLSQHAEPRDGSRSKVRNC